MAGSISGLASGMDTATIINQLMQLEAAPQSRLKTRVSDEKLVVTSLQALNKSVASLATKATALAKDSAWTPISATSSNTAVGVTATLPPSLELPTAGSTACSGPPARRGSRACSSTRKTSSHTGSQSAWRRSRGSA